jgi:hypothetical protein
MWIVAGAFVTLAAAAVIAVCWRVYWTAVEARTTLEKLGKLVEGDLTEAIREWRGTAQGVREAAGKLDDGLGSLAKTLRRVDRVTEKLEPEVLALTVVQPVIARVSSWIGGVRKGLSEVMGSRPHGRPRANGVDTEVG